MGQLVQGQVKFSLLEKVWDWIGMVPVSLTHSEVLLE